MIYYNCEWFDTQYKAKDYFIRKLRTNQNTKLKVKSFSKRDFRIEVDLLDNEYYVRSCIVLKENDDKEKYPYGVCEYNGYEMVMEGNLVVFTYPTLNTILKRINIYSNKISELKLIVAKIYNNKMHKSVTDTVYTFDLTEVIHPKEPEVVRICNDVTLYNIKII